MLVVYLLSICTYKVKVYHTHVELINHLHAQVH